MKVFVLLTVLSLWPGISSAMEGFKPLFRCYKPTNHTRIFFAEFNSYRVVGGNITISANEKRDTILIDGKLKLPCNSTQLCLDENADTFISEIKLALMKNPKSNPDSGYEVIHQNKILTWKVGTKGIDIETSYTRKECTRHAKGLFQPTYAGECTRHETLSDTTTLKLEKDGDEFDFDIDGYDIPFTDRGIRSGFTCKRVKTSKP